MNLELSHDTLVIQDPDAQALRNPTIVDGTHFVSSTQSEIPPDKLGFTKWQDWEEYANTHPIANLELSQLRAAMDPEVVEITGELPIKLYTEYLQIAALAIYNHKKKFNFYPQYKKRQEMLASFLESQNPITELTPAYTWIHTFADRANSDTTFQKQLKLLSELLTIRESYLSTKTLDIDWIRREMLYQISNAARTALEYARKLKFISKPMQQYKPGVSEVVSISNVSDLDNPLAGGFCTGDEFYFVSNPSKLDQDGNMIPMTTADLSIIEAHEKGHYIRSYPDELLPAFRYLLSRGFDWEKLPLGLRNVHELLERMAQLKNAVGLNNGDEVFTYSHLHILRDNYTKHYLDNDMTKFFAAVTPEREDDFMILMNILPI